jgi:hypothetical protein
MCAGHLPELLRASDPHERQFVDVAPVGSPRPRIVDVRKHSVSRGTRGGQDAPPGPRGEPNGQRHHLTLPLVHGLHRAELPAGGRRQIPPSALCYLSPHLLSSRFHYPYFALDLENIFRVLIHNLDQAGTTHRPTGLCHQTD